MTIKYTCTFPIMGPTLKSAPLKSYVNTNPPKLLVNLGGWSFRVLSTGAPTVHFSAKYTWSIPFSNSNFRSVHTSSVIDRKDAYIFAKPSRANLTKPKPRRVGQNSKFSERHGARRIKRLGENHSKLACMATARVSSSQKSETGKSD